MVDGKNLCFVMTADDLTGKGHIMHVKDGQGTENKAVNLNGVNFI